MEALAPIERVPVQQFESCTTTEVPVVQPQTASIQHIQAPITTVGKRREVKKKLKCGIYCLLSFVICTGILVKMKYDQLSFSPLTKVDLSTSKKASYETATGVYPGPTANINDPGTNH